MVERGPLAIHAETRGTSDQRHGKGAGGAARQANLGADIGSGL
jgi:hypothetical protein